MAKKSSPRKAPAKRGAIKARKPGSDGSIRVRMYRHGLGDCFLLQFPRTGGGRAGPFTILIDCGIIPGTPDGPDRLRQVVQHVTESTNREIDVLIATHEHADHVSGFDPEWADTFDKDLGVKEVWLAWTEDPDDKVATSIRAERKRRLAASGSASTISASASRRWGPAIRRGRTSRPRPRS